MGKILVVDDSKCMREKISRILASVGYEIVGEASDGQQAFDE